MEIYKLDPEKRKAFEVMPVPATIYQFVNSRIETLAVSNGFCELFGIDREKAMSLRDFELYSFNHKDDRARMANAAYRFAIDDEPYDIVYRQKNYSTGQFFIVHAIGKHLYTEDGTRLAFVWYTYEGKYGNEHGLDNETNLTVPDDDAFSLELNKVMSEWVHKVSSIHENYFDRLTGVPNNRYFMLLAEEKMFSTMQAGGCPAILFFNMLGMKAFNEKNGFVEGDNLLIAFSEILKKYFGTEGCGRFGSDHFVAYADNDGHLTELLDAMFREIEDMNNGNSIPVRVGICEGEYASEGAKIACDRAKIACDSENKSYVSHYVCFNKSMHDDWLIRAYVLGNVDQAISEGWIRAYYQPLVRGITGLVCNEEALARWDDPEKGMLSPDEFIPALEEAGLLYKVDLHMVDMIIADIKKKKDEDIECVPVSVNLSWNDFQVCDMVEEISERMDDAGISHDMINIEITETVIGSDPDYMRLQIDRFHERGFCVWMDDFGSGYSSLDVLKNYDFDLIKFDMQFMRDFDSSEKSRIVLRELIHLAVKLGIDTVAEGVETSDQVAFLREIGCDRIQGYFYSKPNDIEEILRRYREGKGIGFEDTDETDYYDIISRSDLSDQNVGEKVKESPYSYMNDIPMGIIEYNGEEFYMVRFNKPYADFIENMGVVIPEAEKEGSKLRVDPDKSFAEVIKKCNEAGGWEYYERKVREKYNVRTFLRRLTVNPVTGAAAVMIVILPAAQVR